MSTEKNMQEAFAGESQANRKYTAFAMAADKEGFPQVAKLFRAAANAETVHALLHFRNMGGVGSTAENIQAAIDGETEEYTQMYPGFIEEAKDEGDAAKQPLRAFEWASTVEETHANLYKQALETVKGGGDLEAASIWVCQCCGHTHVGDCPDKCPVCGAAKAKFDEIK